MGIVSVVCAASFVDFVFCFFRSSTPRYAPTKQRKGEGTLRMFLEYFGKTDPTMALALPIFALVCLVLVQQSRALTYQYFAVGSNVHLTR